MNRAIANSEDAAFVEDAAAHARTTTICDGNAIKFNGVATENMQHRVKRPAVDDTTGRARANEGQVVGDVQVATDVGVVGAGAGEEVGSGRKRNDVWPRRGITFSYRRAE